MIRTIMTSFVAILGLTFACPPLATADPIVTSAFRSVYAVTDVPYDGSYDSQQIYSDATSGLFVENVLDAETNVDGAAAADAAQDTIISEFLLGGRARHLRR